MGQELIQKLRYSYTGKHETYPLPLPLKDSLQLITEFFKHSTTNKLCLVFPSKEYAAQWLSVPLALDLIKSDYMQYSNDIYNAYKKYKKGDRLILNNDAIVEWSRAESGFIYFKHKPNKNNEEEIGVLLKNIYKLQPAPKGRYSLSSYDRVRKAISSSSGSPIDSLLEIKTYGNKLFQKKCLCLTSKFKSFDDSIANVLLNDAKISDYFKDGRIDENGNIEEKCPLLISNNFSSLILYLAQTNQVSTILIDGFDAITSRSNFSDIDRRFNIPTILITDLSEIETFEDIKNFGFEFFNFTKENITIKESGNQSPFYIFEKKLSNYVSFKFEREICSNTELESVSQILHSLPKDDSDENLNVLKVSLIQLSNLLSRICHVLNEPEISYYTQKLNNIETHFSICKLWLGDSNKPIQECISLLKSVIEKFSSTPSEKCARLKELMDTNHYDFIICPTEDESKALNNFLNTSVYTYRPQVISVSNVSGNLLSNRPIKAILTGWPKSNNINRILSSFLFSKLTVLFYQFENKYYNSLQRRNRKYTENIRSTINSKGIRSEAGSKKPKGFDDFYSVDEVGETTPESSFDIVEFELKLDNNRYSRYAAKGDIAESCKAKRIEFENNTFIYATESHKFIVINELIDSAKQNPRIHIK
ncbi:MAG: DrmE family protein [Candidatus Loosdrechtia sp.]|uniref:DrmE family protein n=1 Tax=Candidatus Loosdrechtia sp. TaxID=3101272 RepID=UPI003A69CA57|nr:MAG: DrmE family protein [Candidatus Jettenia sp. AMX2]